MLSLFLILFFTYLITLSIEPFNYISKDISKDILPGLKQDPYMDFLFNVNVSLQNELRLNKHKQLSPNYIRQLKSNVIQKSFLNVNDTFFTSNNKHKCIYKSINLSEQINPFLYISTESVRFPPRWIGPYKKDKLPHNINLPRYKAMFNCCNNLNT
jgi:hypothetical protein